MSAMGIKAKFVEWTNILRIVEIWANKRCHLQVTVPPLARGSGMEFNRITLKFFFDSSCWLLRFVVTVELSCRVVLRCSTTCWFCLCRVLRARWVLCVLCSRYSSDAWNVVEIEKPVNNVENNNLGMSFHGSFIDQTF